MASVPRWLVHKFGGTSVANAGRYEIAADIVLTPAHGGAESTRKLVVVSAMAKVTDALIRAVELAKSQNEAYHTTLSELKAKHLEAASALLPQSDRDAFAAAIEIDFEKIAEVLRGVWHLRLASERTVELVSGHGEIWSAQLLDARLRATGHNSTWLDARGVLVVEPRETAVAVDWAASQAKLDAWLSTRSHDLVVATGFVASTADGAPTTLRRNGSDYSASIFGALLKAESITIWTDVDGVLSADPRLVSEAVVLEDLSYAEATELAYFGAKVVHPSTMAPAIRDRIPIWIRNAFNLEAPGTVIRSSSHSDTAVKGFATIDELALVSLEGTGMMGVPGVAQRLFGALREIGVSVILISQASSEHSICIGVPAAQGRAARDAIQAAFALEISQGAIEAIEVDEDCSVLAAVGDGMVRRKGVSGQFLGSLGRAGVNVRAIAQGSSERNISVVVSRADARRALRAVHSGFYLSDHALSIGLIGPGGVGGALLEQLAEAGPGLRKDLGLDLRVRGIATSSRMLLSDSAIDLTRWRENLAANGVPLDIDVFARHVRAEQLPHAAIVDCTSSEVLSRRYSDWLSRGIHLITPNKKANTLEMAYYRELRAVAQEAATRYLYETTVGAGLPIINTLRELHRTGDKILSIEGVLSGTLSFIFNSVGPSRLFSDVVREAKELGYTEPDPRDDLSGVDVARKLTILAREIGLPIELSDVVIEPLLPEELQTGGVDAFMQRLPSIDGAMSERLAKAAAVGESLRFVGAIDEAGRATVSLRSYPASHAFSRLQATDNMVAFRTSRYSNRPLIVQGPGAGREVTAAGVFADMLRLSSYLGAPV